MPWNSTSRIRCLIDYDNELLSVEHIIKLGDSYKVFRSAEIDSQLVDDKLKHKHGQRVVWSHLPLEVRMIIYEYVYAYAYEVAAEQARGWCPIMQVQCVRKWQLRHSNDLRTISFDPDDLYILLHHSLADLLVSKQWFEETAGVMAKLHRRTLSCEFRHWNLFLLVFTHPWTGAAALDELGHLVTSVTFSQAYCLDLKMDHGDMFLDCDMERISRCNQFDEIRVTYLGWQDRLCWIKSKSSDDSLDLLLPQSDQSSSTLINDQAYKLSRITARALRKQFSGCIIYDTGQLPENMRTSFYNWSAETAQFLAFRAIFQQWKRTEPRLNPIFLAKSMCMVRQRPNRVLHINLRLEYCGRLQVYAYRGSNPLHLAGASDHPIDQIMYMNTTTGEQNMAQTTTTPVED